jgi:predicted DNA-binding transcriptional regulator YafY
LYSSDGIGYSRAEFARILLNKNLPSSPTAITRVVEYIDKHYEISIRFGRESGCYIREEVSSPMAMDNFKFSKQVFFKDYLFKLSNQYQYYKDILSFSFDTQNKNSHFLPQLISAILEKKYIQFDYKKSYHPNAKTSKVTPFFIKEYLNRWYVIGQHEDVEFKVFSLDRMANLEVLDAKHKFNPKSVKQIFDDTIGVYYRGENIKVKLWTSKEQYPYFETLPLHASQRLEEETEDGFIFSIQVTHNFELERWILFYGDRLKVLEPQFLQDIIKDELQRTLKQYS